MLVNCRNFTCKFNTKGKCRLESITLQDDGSPLIKKVICIEAEPMDDNCNRNDLAAVLNRLTMKLPGGHQRRICLSKSRKISSNQKERRKLLAINQMKIIGL